MARPTRLQLLMPGWFVDVDAGTRHSVAITRWLSRPGAPPLLVEHVGQSSAQFAQARVSTRVEPRVPAQPKVVRLAEPALGTVAPSADGKGLWVEEYRSRTRCTSREVGLDGHNRRPPRDVRCGTKPIGETRHGLWVAVGPDAFLDATVGSGPPRWNAVLLDPDNLTERRRFPWVEIVDDDRFVAFLDPTYQTMELRDLRTGETTPLARPTALGWPRVWPLSPDRRYLPFSFESPGEDPQVKDVWLLDLHTMAWLHPPSMPAYTMLKGESLAWAKDGRLVLLGDFYESGALLVTWRPGEPALAVMPYQRPAPTLDDAFLVWPHA